MKEPKKYHVRSPAELQVACDAVEGDDVILVHGGVYQEPSKLLGKRGSFGHPIVIRAADDAWISGGRSPDPYWGDENPGEGPGANPPRKPGAKDFAFLIVDRCAHIRIEGLKVRNCWPGIFFLKNSCHVVIRNCTLRNGSFAIVAKDTPEEGPLTSHLLVEGNEWRQDDSDEHLLWTRIDWKRSHGGEYADGMFRHFNGAFLYSKGIRGNVVVRANRVMDAYNGVRMKAGNHEVPEESLPTLNADVHIVGNDFVRIRDNPIEPEVSAYNWHVRHNRLVDCHSWFSFDTAGGGYWYFYGNVGNFESRQGIPGEFGHTMGRVLKLSYESIPVVEGSNRTPIHPWFVFNNSWHLRCPLIGGANATIPPHGLVREGPDFTANLEFFNNAFAWCNKDRHGSWTCEYVEMIRHFDLKRSGPLLFDYNISDRSDYFRYFQGSGCGEEHGVLSDRPIFDDPAAGRLGLAPDSEAYRTGWARSVASPRSMDGAALRLQRDETLNRGAYQDYGLTQVPDLEAQTAELLAQIASGV